MSDDPKVLPFRRPTLTPGPSEQTITVSYPHFLLLLDAFADCARNFQAKQTQLDDLHTLLPGQDEVGTRTLLTRSQEEHQAVAQMLTDLRAMRAEAEQQTD